MIHPILNAPIPSAVMIIGTKESPHARILEDNISTKQNVTQRGQVNRNTSRPI